jgi:formylglycine-generating enzyme
MLAAGAAAAISLFVAFPAFAGELRCPSNMALVGKSCVDKFEGSLVEVTADGHEVPFSAHTPPNGHAVKAKSVPGVTPQAHISMVEAQKACKASGKRLCHANEWKTACKGPENTRYPYGNERVPGACVDTGRTSPVQTLKGGRYDHTAMNDPALNQLANTVEATGATSTCTNTYGVADMVGNVHEWADDGAFHGGYYLDTKINGEGCSYKTTAHNSTYYDYSTGFRCCADAGALPADDAPIKRNEPGDPVAMNDSDANASPANAPAPEPKNAYRTASLSGVFNEGMTIEEMQSDMTADRISYYET